MLSPHPALARSIPSMASGVHSGGCSPKSFDSRRRLCWWASAGSKKTNEKKVDSGDLYGQAAQKQNQNRGRDMW